MNVSPKLDFVVIGAQKSGTSSLYNYLKLHPEIAMSAPMKEPGYFLEEQAMTRYWRSRGYHIESRAELFSKYMLAEYAGEPRFGEASTYYTIGEQSREQEIPRRIREHNPQMKLLYIVRDPLGRFVSSFLHAARKRGGPQTLERFLAESSGRPLLTSCYFWQLSAYLEELDRSQVRVVVFEELVEDPGEALKELHEFLGVTVRDESLDKRVYHRSRNRSDFDPRELSFTRAEYDRLMRDIAPDVEALERWLGRSIPHWDLSPGKWCGR